MSDNQPETLEEKHEVKIDYDGKNFTVVVPVILGKIAAYGAFQMGMELASKVFWAIEKKEAEQSKSVLSKLHIPGMRTQ